MNLHNPKVTWAGRGLRRFLVPAAAERDRSSCSGLQPVGMWNPQGWKKPTFPRPWLHHCSSLTSTDFNVRPSLTIMSEPSYKSLARAKAVGVHCSPLIPITSQKAWGLDPTWLTLGKPLLSVSCHCQLLHMPRCGFQEISFLGFTSDWWPASLLLQPSHWVQRAGRCGWWRLALSTSASLQHLHL